MSWEDQGRQEHGWFGHGTAPVRDEPSGTGPDPLFDAGNYAPRIDTIAFTALAHMPRKDRHRETLSFDRTRLDRLRRAMTAWIAARSLSDTEFAQRLLDSPASGTAIGKLRAAAEGVRTATTRQDLANASADLAAGMQAVGLDNWPRFLRGAAERAEAGQSGDGRVMLAQATSNTATDAGAPAAASAALPPGRYVADNPRQWDGQPSVGTGECVPLVQKATGAPRSTLWRAGVRVQSNTSIRPGTAIATFDANGHYHGHAAIYLGQDEKGIRVIDQWNRPDEGHRARKHHPPSERIILFNHPRHDLVDQGEFYHVVE